jgi:hypothetical protein
LTGSSGKVFWRHLRVRGGVAVDAELGDEALQHAEEPDAVVEAGGHQLVEAVGAERSRRAVHLDDERPLAGLESGTETVRRRVAHHALLAAGIAPLTVNGEHSTAVKAAPSDVERSPTGIDAGARRGYRRGPSSTWEPVMRVPGLAVILLSAVAVLAEPPPEKASLPVDAPALLALEEIEHLSVRNAIDPAWILDGVRDGNRGGLELDLSGVGKLLDGTTVEAKDLVGKVWLGPYPFEAAETGFRYVRYRKSAAIRGGKGTLPIASLLREKYNSEQWTDHGTVAVRVELTLAKEGPDRSLGAVDTIVSWRLEDGAFRVAPTIVEGPLVGMITSDDPTRAVVSLRVSEPMPVTIEVEGAGRVARVTSEEESRRHEVALTGLSPSTSYRYRVLLGETPGCWHTMRTAPVPGGGPVRFGFLSDSREGVGGGDLAHMGVNRRALEMLSAVAYREGAQFLLMGGDLVNGYTTVKRDFEAQLEAWKRGLTGYWSERPVYPTIGNHEALLRVFRDAEGRRLAVDRWPYATDSAEAVFEREFVNPRNGPEPSDPRRPTYLENVYWFRYGPMMLVAFNNNYWVSYAASRVGGAPEGIILDDQMRWLEAVLDRAEADPTVHHVILYSQEPVVPCGGHVDDAMWYRGNNTVRAYETGEDGKLRAASPGILDIRNRFVRLMASRPKVAAVLAGDEHGYHRLLVDRRVPLGDPPRDDRDGDGRIEWPEEPCSPLADLGHPVLYFISGGAGAPYYAEETTPWTAWWRERQKKGKDRHGFRSSSQENILIFTASETRLTFEAVNPFGEVIDSGRIR